MRLPRTKAGWKRLFWIALRRCMVCHERLVRDWPLYDDGGTLWCFRCGGLAHPRGVLRTLQVNAMAAQKNMGSATPNCEKG